MIKNPKFLDLIIERNLISVEEKSSLTEKYSEDAFLILFYLVSKFPDKKAELGKLWADSLGTVYVDLKKTLFQYEVVKQIPEDMARKYQLIPIYKFGNAVTVATADPTHPFFLDEAKKFIGCQISAVFSFPDEIQVAINTYYSPKDPFKKISKEGVINLIFKDKSYLLNNTEIDNLDNSDKKAEIYESLISRPSRDLYINTTKEITNLLFANKRLNPAAINILTDRILKETSDLMNKVNCLKQLTINDSEFTYSHPVNTAILSSYIAKSFGISASRMQEITLGAYLHDVGKVKIPDKILHKSGDLDSKEFEIVKKHTLYGYSMIKDMGFSENIANIAYNHHEKINGEGYPRGLKGNEVSTLTQIVSLADLYDALLSNTYVGNQITHEKAVNIILSEGIGTYDSEVLYQFEKIAKKNQNESA